MHTPPRSGGDTANYGMHTAPSKWVGGILLTIYGMHTPPSSNRGEILVFNMDHSSISCSHGPTPRPAIPITDLNVITSIFAPWHSSIFQQALQKKSEKSSGSLKKGQTSVTRSSPVKNPLKYQTALALDLPSSHHQALRPRSLEVDCNKVESCNKVEVIVGR